MPPSEVRHMPLEMWGGIECSHVRIGDVVRDQRVETGHRDRPGDLDLIADLGVRTLRYPVIWGAEDGWGWHDARLSRLRALGVRPIAGFLHHGWGPGQMHALHDGFVDALAAHAEEVARRYPWVRDFTPINEPVTTARFSYLYGHWHPHMTEEAAFLRAVVACARATAEAMRRIRVHRPDARLIQTEDFGRVFAPPALRYQADHENARRFLATDLLTGRVTADHPFHARLLSAGVAPGDLARLADAPCPPDIVGLDYYLTSDRLLDPDLSRHPPVAHGGNGRDIYADTAAVHERALLPELGFLPRLREVHRHTGLPVAVTEAHAACTREDQVRWLCEAWEGARAARAEGVPVVAVTSWALFGAVDWNSLLTRADGHYENGAFCLRDGAPRRTAVADAIAAICAGGAFPHPLTAGSGWWGRAAPAPSGIAVSLSGNTPHRARLAACCEERGIAVVKAQAGPGAHVGIDDAPGEALRLTLRHPAAPAPLTREVPHADALAAEAHHLLDRLIDLSVGAWDAEAGARVRRVRRPG
jgi:beta-glucosidase/6-phospho-beta-glucosidase/beta-galactosidase